MDAEKTFKEILDFNGISNKYSIMNRCLEFVYDDQVYQASQFLDYLTIDSEKWKGSLHFQYPATVLEYLDKKQVVDFQCKLAFNTLRTKFDVWGDSDCFPRYEVNGYGWNAKIEPFSIMIWSEDCIERNFQESPYLWGKTGGRPFEDAIKEAIEAVKEFERTKDKTQRSFYNSGKK